MLSEHAAEDGNRDFSRQRNKSMMPIKDLISPEALDGYSESGIALVSILDANGVPIGGSCDLDLCRVFAETDSGSIVCADCPVSLDGRQVSGFCVAHVTKAVAPILFDEELYGYVKCQAPTGSFFNNNLSILPPQLKADIDARFSHRTVPKEDLEVEAKRIAGTVARRCIRERIKVVLRKAIRQISMEAAIPNVLGHVFKAVETLLGRVDMLFYAANPGGVVTLIDSRGPTALAAPKALARGQGHVGRVIFSREAIYATDLIRNPDGFIQIDDAVPAKVALTVPSEWHADALPAALQITSREDTPISPDNILVIEILGRTCGLSLVKLARQSDHPALVTQSLDWHKLLLELTVQPANTALQILDRKRRLYNAVAERALRISNGFAASVRLRDAPDYLRFVSFAGPGWTDDLIKAAAEERPKESAGLRAIKEEGPYMYVSELRDATWLNPIFPQTKSLCVVPFSIRNRKIGVLTVSWDRTKGAGDAVLGELTELVRDFATVLEVLVTREQNLFQSFENQIIESEDWNTVFNDVVEQLRQSLDTAVCSLFLKHPGEDILKFAGSTSIRAEQNAQYPLGEGLTGWIAVQRRALRLRNIRDPEDLKKYAPPPKHSGRFKDMPDASESGPLSYLGVPLVSRGQLIGVVRVSSTVQREFSPEEELFLQDAADRIARAIDSVWMEQRASVRIQEVEQHLAFQRMLAKARGLKEICEVLLEGFMRSEHAFGGYIKLVDKSAAQTSAEIALGILKSFHADTDSLTLVAEPEYFSNFKCWPELHDWARKTFPDIDPLVIGSAARIPITFKSENIRGTLALCWRAPGRLDDQRKQELTRMAHRLTEATESSFERIQQENVLKLLRGELESLRRVEEALALDRDHNELMHSILDLAIKQSGMTKGSIRFYNPTRSTWTLKAPLDPLDPKTPIVIDTDCVLERTLNAQEDIYVADTRQDPLWNRLRNGKKGTEVAAYLDTIASSLHLPLRLHREYIGAILLDSTEFKDVDDDTRAYLGVLAHHAAVAIKIATIRELAEPLAMMGTMLADFLHAFRNPLANALASFELLDRTDLSPDERAAQLCRAQSSIERLRDICSRLELSIGRGQPAMDEAVVVADLISAIIGDFTNERVKVVRQFASPTLSVRGNGVLLEIACKMIIQNAFEAMPEGGVLTITAAQSAGTVTIAFRDTGTGMDDLTKSCCLIPFFTTKKKEEGGTGLGLPVANGIVKRHGGMLRVETEPGKGSAFSMIFQQKKEEYAQNSRG